MRAPLLAVLLAFPAASLRPRGAAAAPGSPPILLDLPELESQTLWSFGRARRLGDSFRRPGLWFGGDGSLNAAGTSWDFRSDAVRPTSCQGASEDGRLRVCAAGKDSFGVRDAESAAWVRKFKARASVAAISPDGALAASYDDRRKPAVGLWDTGTGERRAVLEGCGEKIGRLVFSPGGRFLAGTCVSEEFRDYGTAVWDAEAGTRVQTLPHSAHFRGPVSFSPDGAWVALADSVQAVVYEVSGWRKARSLACRGELVRSAAFSGDGAYLAAATSKGVCLWEAASGRRVQELDAAGGEIEAIAFGPPSKDDRSGALAAVDSKGKAFLWNSRPLDGVLEEIASAVRDREAGKGSPETRARRDRWLAERRDRGYPFRVRAELGGYDRPRGGLVVRFTTIPAAPQQTTHEALVPMTKEKASELAAKWGEPFVHGLVYFKDEETAELADAYLSDGLSAETFPFGRTRSAAP